MRRCPKWRRSRMSSSTNSSSRNEHKGRRDPEKTSLFGIVCFQSACPLVCRFSIGARLVCRAANNDINLIVRQSKSLCYSQEPSHHIHAIISSEGILLSWAHAGRCVCLTTSIRKTIYQVLLKSNQYHFTMSYEQKITLFIYKETYLYYLYCRIAFSQFINFIPIQRRMCMQL